MLNIFVIFVIIVLLRLVLAYETSSSLLYNLDGEFLSILTPDASLYGYYARLLLDGLQHNSDVYLIEYVIYILVKITPFSLDQIIYILPAFLSSLVVVPTMLITRLFIDKKYMVSMVGLIVGIGYGYYSRTYLGYCDTDMLNLFFPMMMLYGMVLSVRDKKLYHLLIVIVSTILYMAWYHSSLVLIYAMDAFFIIYMLAINYKKFIYNKYITFSSVLVLLVVISQVDVNQFLFHANRYIFKSKILDNSGFYFVSPMQLIAEAKSTNLQYIAHLISGNIIIFIASFIGYVLLVVRHKEMLLALPMLVLGLLSIKAGVRFHIYAIGVMAISYVYFGYYVISRYKLKNTISILLVTMMFIVTVYENYRSLQYYNTKVAKPVFYPEQVQALKALQKIKSNNAYAITWWDYGWPVRYYGGLKTMIDNGRHHADNYTVANILVSPSQKFTHHASNYFYDLFAQDNKRDAITQGLQQEKNPKRLFAKINNEELKISKKVDKYIILPIQMNRLIYTIYQFANINPQTGKRISSHVFRRYIKLNEDNNFIYFNKNAKLDKRTSKLIQSKQEVIIKRFSQVVFRKNKKMKKIVNFSDKGLNLIKFVNQYYVMDDYFYNSTIVQMMFFNNYDKKYFLPIYEGQTISIYKVR